MNWANRLLSEAEAKVLKIPKDCSGSSRREPGFIRKMATSVATLAVAAL